MWREYLHLIKEWPKIPGTIPKKTRSDLFIMHFFIIIAIVLHPIKTIRRYGPDFDGHVQEVIDETKAKLKEFFGKLKAKLKESFGKLNAKLKESFGKLKAKLKKSIAKLKESITKLKEFIAKLVTFFKESTPEFIKRWLWSTNHRDIGTLYLYFSLVQGFMEQCYQY